MTASKRERCGGKLIYATFERAVHAALVSNRRCGEPLRPYQCATCGGGWHLTRSPGNKAVGVGVWFTSDLHFGHRLVAGHRGFESTEGHDAAIVSNWRKSIASSDQVWVLGDIAVTSPKHALAIIADLPGTKHLIAGNHDGCHPMHRDSHKRVGEYLEVFASVQAFARRRIGGQEVFLSHFPYAKDRGEARYMQYRLRDEGAWLLHGHTHGSERVEGREIHVGLDAWGLKPVNLGTIEALTNPAPTSPEVGRG